MEDSIFVYRNEVSEPKVWFRLAQLGIEGRGQGGRGGAQLSRGLILPQTYAIGYGSF